MTAVYVSDRVKITTLGQHQRADPVGYLPDRDASDLFQCFHIDGGYRLGPARGNINGPAVRRESDPRGSPSPGRLPRHRRIGQRDMSHQFEVWERVDENGISRPAVGPQGLVVRRYANSVA